MLLEEKVAVVYGAGSIGGAVATAFGAEGARVFVGDRTGAKAEALAGEIEEAGRLDVSFNLISVGDVQGAPLTEMGRQDFVAPIENAVRSNFLTVKAAVPQMVRGGGGHDCRRDG